ncbi:hypothetical protein PGT21_011593 [Puccinia graminis f. sp. tritici]|uniref:Uncharacterized protein n=1 Tax=Puccinia graminis f. sp. tritici TaxID=56615 RepID=A0A5B0N3L4_PUCGR|nr:hypothetical protein PGT21_011593 [Puccinia graminis f. sp. tritici]
MTPRNRLALAHRFPKRSQVLLGSPEQTLRPSTVTTIIAVIKASKFPKKLNSYHPAPKTNLSERSQLSSFNSEDPQDPIGLLLVSPSVPVNLQENSELIQRYLIILRLRKEEAERNYQPTPWEKLSEEEQLLLATYHAHIHQEEDLEQQIQFRSFLREIREKNSQLRRKKYLERMSTFETGVIRQERASPTPSVDTDNGSSDLPTNLTNQTSKVPSQLQQDLAAAKELQARVASLQMTTLARKEPATLIPETTEKNRSDPPPNTEKDMLMDVDEIESECSEATPKRPITPEIRVLSKEDQIKLRVKEHVSLWRQCQVATREGPTEKLRALLTTAQESQKALQKLIDNEEIESYVKGWNPWDEKKVHFPSPPKKNVMKFKRNDSGKRQSSTSTNFSDPAKWKKVTDLLQMASGLYQNV